MECTNCGDEAEHENKLCGFCNSWGLTTENRKGVIAHNPKGKDRITVLCVLLQIRLVKYVLHKTVGGFFSFILRILDRVFTWIYLKYLLAKQRREFMVESEGGGGTEEKK